MPGPGGGVADHAGLGADVDLQTGRVTLGQLECARIGHDDGIHPQLVQKGKPFGQTVDFLVAGHGVAGDVKGDAGLPAQNRRLTQLLGGEIARPGAHAEHGAAEIHRVRSVGEGHLQPLRITRRGQQLGAPAHC
ncbi:hypothetical protein SDC9_162821 [bioreactor metagenome]|uniref:Uncharacterized protein n=1 Tax=bioreactor metagenome TaxID=1076179 RepID=A0A645FM43_9ZZZZ